MNFWAFQKLVLPLVGFEAVAVQINVSVNKSYSAYVKNKIWKQLIFNMWILTHWLERSGKYFIIKFQIWKL